MGLFRKSDADRAKELYNKYDYEAALPYVRKAAEEHSNSHSKYLLGVMYKQGLAVPQNAKLAEFWLKQAANKKVVLSYRELGDLYHKDFPDFEKNFSKTLIWYKKANKQKCFKNYSLTHEIGYLYRTGGYGIEKDYGQAIFWYEKNLTDLSTYEIGCIYQEGGYGVKQDYNKAMEWFTKAIMKREYYAFMKMGMLYQAGGGDIQKDYVKALECYTFTANEEGASEAMYYIGTLYQEGGYGLLQDYSKALFWYTKSLENDSKKAARLFIDQIHAILKEKPP